MNKKSIAFVFCLSVLSSWGFANNATKAQEQNIDKTVTAFMQSHKIPGLALAVLKDGKPFLVKGYGYADMQTRKPVDTHTLFGIASVSKVITAFAVMNLIQEGKIDLNNSILNYVPKAPRKWREVTVKQLLSHSSGIPQYQGPHQSWNNVWNKLAKKPMQFQPGTAVKYNNFGFNLLGRAIENVSHQSLGDYLAQTIFIPLGMNQTSFPESLFPANLAKGYSSAGNKISPNPNRGPWLQKWASGGIVTSIDDMAKWDNAMSAGKILTSASYKKMWTPVYLNNGEPTGKGNMVWALGWQVETKHGKRRVSKNGGIAGYSSWIERHLDDKVSIIILVNTNHVQIKRLANQLFNQVMKRN